MRIALGVVPLIVLCLSLTACGQEPPPAQPQATTPSVSPTPAASTAAAGTASTTQITLGDLAARIEAAWPSLHSYRSSFTGATVISLNPPASPTAQLVANWPEVAWAGLDRLRDQQQRDPFDPQLAELVTLAAAAVAGVPRPDTTDQAILVCP